MDCSAGVLVGPSARTAGGGILGGVLAARHEFKSGAGMDYQTIIANAYHWLPAVRRIEQLSHYEEKGIFYSEILFMAACLHGKQFNRIVESGRARGQSTSVLSQLYPEHQILSIDSRKNSRDANFANRRLASHTNCSVVFGDSRRVLIAHTGPQDVVLIDGPKGYEAIKLAWRVLALCAVDHVFIHDLSVGTRERESIQFFAPEARYSDNAAFAAMAHVLDEKCKYVLPARHTYKPGEDGYGFGLAYIPRTVRDYSPKLLAHGIV